MKFSVYVCSVNFTQTLLVKLWGRKVINMALNDKTNLLVQNYGRSQYPEFEEGLRRFIADELQRIDLSTTSLANAAIQVLDNPPSAPVKGMARYAVSP